MSTIRFKGKPVETIGELPGKDTRAPDFQLTRADLTDVSLADFAGRVLVLNIFPSVDTPVCAASVRRFNEEAGKMDNVSVLCVSADLPFALDRFCGAEGLNNVIPVSVFRSGGFGKDYGVLITSGPLAGLLSRAVIIIDGAGSVVYTEQVPEISDEPDYKAALKAAGSSG